MKSKVVVAMSGGVDSSAAAGILQKQGYEVIGITMCFGFKEAGKKKPSCCGIEGIEDARRVAHTLGFKHYVLNFDQALEEKVIKNFVSEYLSGRTPNPCIRCNEYLKFERLLNKAKSLGAKYLATGHYAKIVHSPQSTVHSQKYLLKKGKDEYKDQSYFLYRLKQEQLKQILFPLGDYTKTQVRKIAADFDLPVKDKPGSQEICFVPDDDYRAFLKHRLTRILKPGPIADAFGKVVGEHKGIPFYTIGQREGLGLAMGYPVYITKIDARKNTIVIGRKEEVESIGLIAGDLSFTNEAVKREVALRVRIRYNHPEVYSKITPLDGGKVKVIFSQPQFAVTPGQSAVFYRGNTVVGGGIIESGLKNAEDS